MNDKGGENEDVRDEIDDVVLVVDFDDHIEVDVCVVNDCIK